MESLILDYLPDFLWSLFKFMRPALALFNMLLLFWLGLTVLLQVERRRSSVWFASFSLLMAATFFGVYTIEMGGGPGLLFLEILWLPALLLLHTLPLCWHIVVLYFTGQFDRGPGDRSDQSFFRRWPRGVLPYLVLALFFATPFALYNNDSAAVPGIREFSRGLVPFDRAPSSYTLFLALFCIYILFAAVGSLVILARHRMPSGSLKQTARLRARASFLGAGLALAAVSLVVTGLCFYFIWQRSVAGPLTRGEVIAILRFDTPLAFLIAIAVLFTGRAAIYYELFSGALPRRGLFRQWHLAVAFAVAAGFFFTVVRWFFGTGGFTILGTSTLAVLVFVLMGRSHNRERNQYLAFMRPFLGSQNLYETVVQSESPGTAALSPPVPFAALCRDVLGVSRAFLYPIGEARPFIESPLIYPADLRERPADPEALERIEFDPQRRFHPLDPERYGGALLAIPLWSRRGVAGVLLLGEQTGGGLYTQEEVEIAQAAGERIIDTLAVARISRIVLSLQRNRIIEGRLGDDRARRIVHDDVLPEIHTILLRLSSSGASQEFGEFARDILERLTDVHVTLARLLREMPITTHPDVLRLGLSEALRHAAEREGGFDRIVWESATDAERFVSHLPGQVQETVFYAAREMLRNSARHARMAGSDLELRFRMRKTDDGLHMTIEDNGGGMRDNAGTQGTGQGLSLHGALLAVVGGSLSMETLPGRYTRAHIRLRGKPGPEIVES